MVKRNMMVVGAECIKSNSDIPGKGIVELTLVPLNTVKVKRPGLMDMIHGDMEGLMNEVTGMVPNRFKMYISLEEWRVEFRNQLFCHVTVDIVYDGPPGGKS